MPQTPDTDELIRYIVESLVDKPESVDIVRRSHDDSVTFEISVDEEDVGKVIGRQGRIVKAIRTLMRAAGSLNGEHIDVDVLG